MARSKRPITLPEGPQRPAVRRRTTEDQPPENVTGDLNEPPPLSGEPPIATNTPESASSKQPSPTAVSSSKGIDSNPVIFEETDEEERRLAEEYQMKLSAIKKKKEDAERRRKEEEERARREEEARIKREEEDRIRKEEEERIRKEEEERIRKEEEEKMEKEKQEKEQKELEDKRKAKEEARLKELEEELRKKQEEQIQTVAGASQEPTQLSAHSGDEAIRKTRSGLTRRPPTKRLPKKPSGKGKTIEHTSSDSSFELDSDQPTDEHPHQSTVGTDHAPSGIPRQFTTPGAAEHFACIVGHKLNLERGFDPEFVDANPFVRSRIDAQDWSTIASANRRANASLVKEFYAEASQTKDPVVRVRGKTVKYTPSEINRVLGRPTTEVCAFARFIEKMTEGDEEAILKEIAVEGKPWGKDGIRRCLPAGSLTTEAAIWFQFIRTSVSPTTHDTTLSMHKCALLYCVLTGKRINLGIIMHAAIHTARTRKKVILPLPCVITALLIDAGVPTAAEDQWLTSTSNISVQTIKKMGRSIRGPSEEPPEQQPRVMIAEEHTVGTVTPTVGKKKSTPRQATAEPSHVSTTPADASTLAKILSTLKKMNYRLDLMEAEQRFQGRATNSFWMYTRERDEVMGQFLKETNPLLAAMLPSFPEGICATYDSEEDDEAASSSHATPTP